MYALLLLSGLGPGMRSTAEKLGDQLAPAHRAAKGFKTETFLADDTAGEYGSLTLWKFKEDVEAFRKAAGPQLQKALSGIAEGPPSARLFEVYEPKVQLRGQSERFPSTCGSPNNSFEKKHRPLPRDMVKKETDDLPNTYKASGVKRED